VADSNQKSKIEVGEWVLLAFGEDPLEAQVVEDRGNLGYKGRRLLRVAVPMEDDDEPVEFEVPEADLIRAA
jgi:hypothetical protein